MKISLFLFRRRSVLPALLLGVSPAVFAAPAATTDPPAAPALPRSVAFSDKVDGRRLLFAARDSYRNAPSLRVSCWWTTVDPGGKTTSGTETLLTQFSKARLAITSETDDTTKTVRRAIANGVSEGGSLLVTEYRATTPGPTRQFSRYPLDDIIPLTRSLQMARFVPTTKASDLLLTSDWGLQNAAAVFVSRPDSIAGSTAILQTDIPVSGDRARTKVLRRYLLDSRTNRLRRYEEWRMAQTPPRAAAYRREEYTEAAAPVIAAAFSQALPAGYTEQSIPAATLPPLPRQPVADPRALALLHKWQMAQERFLTLNLVADVHMDFEQRTENSRPPRNRQGQGRGDILWTLWRMQPGQARIVVNSIEPTTHQPNVKADYVVVADGQRIRINDYLSGNSDTNGQRDPADVPLNRLRGVARQAWDGGLGWFFDGPPDPSYFSQIALDTSPEGPVLVFSRQDTSPGNGTQRTETRLLWRVTLGPDSLPRQFFARRDTDVGGAFERDQPPASTTTIRLQRVSVDAEPLPETFILPQEIARR